MASYLNEKVDSNGSFLVKSTGAIQYQGLESGDNNQIATYDADNGALTSSNLEDLIGQFEFFFAVSQYTGSEPSTRPEPESTELEIGDLWTDTATKFMYIWDGSAWVLLRSPDSNPVGTVISNVSLVAPAGYLPCDGTPIPSQYTQLLALIPGGSTPSVNPGAGLFAYIKF